MITRSVINKARHNQIQTLSYFTQTGAAYDETTEVKFQQTLTY